MLVFVRSLAAESHRKRIHFFTDDHSKKDRIKRAMAPFAQRKPEQPLLIIGEQE
jgi:hypothetical protein